MTGIKICGLKRPEDIEIINELKPDYCGFVINFPKSRRSLAPKEVRDLVRRLERDQIRAVGVFVDEDPLTVADLLESGVIDMAQLHGNEDEKYIERLRSLTGKPIIQAFTVRDGADITRALVSSADHILLDRGQGSGRTFDWSVLEGNEELKSKKWFLAGGLNEDNIAQAIIRFHPFAVDLSSAVETDGFKDREKIQKVIQTVRRTDQ